MNSDFPRIDLVPVMPADHAALCEAAARIWPDAYGEILPEGQIEYMLSLGYTPQAIADDVVRGVRYRWIEVDGTKAGFLAYGPVAERAPVFLHRFYLETSRQGGGVGTASLALLKREAAGDGATAIDLRVNRHNENAIAFYLRRGFEITGEDRKDIGSGYVMDDYLMRLPL